MKQRNDSVLSIIAAVQAAYFIPFSILGLLHRRSFEWITGKKQDYWLVRTVCLLLISVGGVIGRAGATNRVTPEIAALGIGSSASLAAIDIWYGGKGRIRRIYLLDALANAGLIGGWSVAIRKQKPARTI